MARIAGVTRGAIGNVLRGDRQPGPELLTAIANAFKIPPAHVFRIAGVLPEKPECDEFIEKIVHQISQMDDVNKNYLYEYALLLNCRERDLVGDFLVRYNNLEREERVEAQRKLMIELGIVEPGSRRSD